MHTHPPRKLAHAPNSSSSRSLTDTDGACDVIFTHKLSAAARGIARLPAEGHTKRELRKRGRGR